MCTEVQTKRRQAPHGHGLRISSPTFTRDNSRAYFGHELRGGRWNDCLGVAASRSRGGRLGPQFFRDRVFWRSRVCHPVACVHRICCIRDRGDRGGRRRHPHAGLRRTAKTWLGLFWGACLSAFKRSWWQRVTSRMAVPSRVLCSRWRGGARAAGQFASASVLASGRGSRGCQIAGIVDQPADLMG